MKIQRGIVKYKDRSDIVCTYALTDDGKQYYFLDETDTKKFTNGNRIASTALVEAIDPMVKAEHVGIIDENGVIVVPFDNRSIRPVNDNVILVEKAVPTSQNVLDAIELRNDPASATALVSTPATIKDRLNAQMGVEGKYFFNDQFSEATICDINGTNLVNGESYSFVSMANDKLYLSKNLADSPISEFSLTTYELTAAPAVNSEAIDVSNTVVDQQVVEDALSTPVADTVGVPVDGMAAVESGVPAEGAVPAEAVDENAVADTVGVPVDGMAAVDGGAPVEGAVPAEAVGENTVADTVGVPVDGMAAVESGAPVDGAVPAEAVDENTVADTVGVPADGMAAVDGGAPVDGAVPAEAVDENTVADTVGVPVDGMASVEGGAPVDGAVSAETAEDDTDEIMPYIDEEKATTENDMNVDFPIAEDAVTTAVTDEDTIANNAISDDLKAFTNGAPLGEEAEDATDEEEVVEESPVTEDDKIDDVPEETVEEKQEVTDDAEVSEVVEETPAEEERVEEATEEVVEDKPPVVEESELTLDIKADTEESDDTAEDEKKDEIVGEVDNNPTEKKTVSIDAETVLATVDRDNNGIIDSEELMVPQKKNVPENNFYMDRNTHSTSLTDMFQANDTPVDNYGYDSYETESYTPSRDYSSLFSGVKTDTISYDSLSDMGSDNIMADVAKSMTELMKQNRDQRKTIAKYQSEVKTLESQARMLSDKVRDQAEQYKSLSGNLRKLDEAAGRLEHRVHEQEQIISSQESELRTLRAQVEGKQDLVRILAEAKSVLGNQSQYGYDEGENYYRRVA